MRKKCFRNLLLAVFLCLSSTLVCGQDNFITLERALSHITSTYAYDRLQKDSIIYSYKHRAFKASVLPQISLGGIFPNFSRAISLVTQPEGYDKYVTRSFATSNFGFNISQLLPFTGGTISLSSSLERQDNFNFSNNRYAYYFNLFNVSYSQALFSYNAYKWNRKVDRLSESIENISYYQQVESIKHKIIELFFNLLIAQREYEASKENFTLCASVYDKAEKLFHARRMSKEDLLAAKIEYIRSKDALNTVELTSAQNELKMFLKLNCSTPLTAIFNDNAVPQEHLDIDLNKIIEKAIKYNYSLKHDYDILHKKIELKEIKKTISPKVSLSLGSGYNSQFQSFSDVLNDKVSRMSASISISVPIYDGGIGKYKKSIAQVELSGINNLYQNNIESATLEYEKELLTINLLISSIKTNKESLDLIQQRINIMVVNVENGTIDIQNLIQLRVQQLRTFIAYNEQIKNLYLLIYKYRFLSLIDARSNKSVINKY